MTEWSAGVARVAVATHSGGNPHENVAQSRYVLLTSLAPPVQQAVRCPDGSSRASFLTPCARESSRVRRAEILCASSSLHATHFPTDESCPRP